MKDLIELYKISAPSGRENKMVNFIEKKLRSLGATTRRDKMNNLYAVKGISDTYPCVIAHTDEVHAQKPKSFEVLQHKNMIFGVDTKRNKFAGIGADDKNGIWVALKCFEKYDVIKAAFFVSEEIGCIGSRAADMKFFDDCRFVLQCDRKNGSDFITTASMTELCSDEFVAAAQIEQFGYKPATGIMTDVMQLKENGLNVSCANISCGYYNAHSDNEYTVISELENCLKLVENIIETCTDVYPHENIFIEQYRNVYDFSFERTGKRKRFEDIVDAIEEYHWANDWTINHDELYAHLTEKFPSARKREIFEAYEYLMFEGMKIESA